MSWRAREADIPVRSRRRLAPWGSGTPSLRLGEPRGPAIRASHWLAVSDGAAAASLAGAFLHAFLHLALLAALAAASAFGSVEGDRSASESPQDRRGPQLAVLQRDVK